MSLFENHIPLLKPWLDKEEIQAVNEVIASGWISQGPKVIEFENIVASYVGAKYAVATNACTSAIHLGLRIQGVTYGDDVIVADTTCMANVNAIKMAGANPVFVDIEPDTYNINSLLIEKEITPKTKAIINIDQIGLASDIDKIKEIAKKHSLAIVDDAATALGGKFKGEYFGGHGVVSTFSFHPRKMITTGEGGMLVTDNKEVADLARILRSTGASISDLDRHKAKGVMLQEYYDSGYNYRLTDIQAAIGIVQMKKIDKMLKERNKQAEFYNNVFSTMDELIVPYVPKYATHAYSSYLLKINNNTKISVKEIIHKMSENNISCRYGIQPLHREPYFKVKKYTDDMFPVSCEVAEKTFFIPIFPGLKKNEQQFIIDKIKDVFIKNYV